MEKQVEKNCAHRARSAKLEQVLIMKKIGIITQARMTSTRLPEKVLINVLGKPILAYQIEKIKKTGYPLFVATTVNPSDDAIVKLCQDYQVPFFRGSEHDVLSRYYFCAKNFGLDIIIRITSDCPLIDEQIIKNGLAQYLALNDENIYYSNIHERTYPTGFDFEIFSFKSLEEAHLRADQVHEREHVTFYLTEGRMPQIKMVHDKRQDPAPDYRITLDTPQDLQLIKELIEKYQAHLKNVDEIIAIFRAHPELKLINQDIVPKYY